MADPEPEASADEPSTPERDEESVGDGPETLRERVEAKYDFDRFGPADMAEMSVEEWEAVFDPETWITGVALVDRVEADLRSRVASGQLFAVVERHAVDGEPRVLAYDDASYAVVHSDGTVEGEGAVRRDVEPIVALCSMDSYEVEAPPADAGLPDPASIEPGTGGLGHRLLLGLALVQVVAGLVLLFSPLLVSLGPGSGALTTVVGLGFLLVGVVMGVLVANARLSDRFRAAAYRDRLHAAGVGSAERPAFLPPMDGSAAAGAVTGSGSAEDAVDGHENDGDAVDGNEVEGVDGAEGHGAHRSAGSDGA